MKAYTRAFLTLVFALPTVNQPQFNAAANQCAESCHIEITLLTVTLSVSLDQDTGQAKKKKGPGDIPFAFLGSNPLTRKLGC
jgi:hypothetical protein